MKLVVMLLPAIAATLLTGCSSDPKEDACSQIRLALGDYRIAVDTGDRDALPQALSDLWEVGSRWADSSDIPAGVAMAASAVKQFRVGLDVAHAKGNAELVEQMDKIDGLMEQADRSCKAN